MIIDQESQPEKETLQSASATEIKSTLMKAENPDLPQNQANVLFQPSVGTGLSAVLSNDEPTMSTGGTMSGHAQGLKVVYDTHVDKKLMAAT